VNVYALIRHRWNALFAVVAVLTGAGVYMFTRLPSAIFPAITFPIVKVIADAGEEPAARMMPTVTRPLEEAMRRVPGAVLVRSITSRGSSELSAQFAWGTDMEVALQRVQMETERVRPDLPPDTRVDVEWMNPASFPILGYALTSTTHSQADLLQLAEYTLKPELIRIPDVAEVQVQGGRRREFEVHLDPAALQGRGLSAADVVRAIQADNDILSAGLIERNHELYLSLVSGRVHALDTLAELSVPVPGGPPTTLGSLGALDVADEVSYVRTTANGDSAVLVNLIRQPEGNTVAIAEGVQQLLRERPDLLPPGVTWTPFYDQARFVSASVAGTIEDIEIGFVLAALVLFAGLGSLRLTVVAGLAIPVTIAIVGLLLGATGQTTNVMTLAGIAAAIGLIADDMIVVVERIEALSASEPGADTTERAVHRLFPALLASSLSTTVILIPFALLTGITGAFFKPLALTMAFCLIVSFFLAWLLIPAGLQLAGLPERHAPRGGSLGRRLRAIGAALQGVFEAVVRWFIRWPALASLALAGLITAVWISYRTIGTDFLPSMDEGAIVLDYWTPPGTSLTETDHMLRDVEAVIQSLPDVANYSRRTGTQLGFFITEPNTGDYVINLKPRGTRRPVDEVMDDLRTRIAAIEPAIRTDFGQLIEDEIGDLTGGEPQPIDVKIFGSDVALLQQKAREAAAIIAAVPGVEDAFDGITIAGPALNIHVRPLAAARYGLTTEDIQEAVQPAVIGTVADQVRVGDRLYDLRVFLDTTGVLSDLLVRSSTQPAALVPLRELATIGTGPPEAEIDRENLRTYVGVTARLSGRDLGSTIAQIQRDLRARLTLAPGQYIRYGGLYEQQQQSFNDLFFVLLGGLGLVAVIVLFQFGDWRAAVLTVFSAVAVLAGVFLALIVTGTTLNISSYVGAIMMVGIVGEKSVFAIAEGRRQLRLGLPPREAWFQVARTRLRPVVMTILATDLALAPLAVAIGQGSQLMQALAIAVIGGFMFSGIIVLFLLPSLYCWLDPRGKLASH
jgi:CzcA family heavy metal efflux pump